MESLAPFWPSFLRVFAINIPTLVVAFSGVVGAIICSSRLKGAFFPAVAGALLIAGITLFSSVFHALVPQLAVGNEWDLGRIMVVYGVAVNLTWAATLAVLFAAVFLGRREVR